MKRPHDNQSAAAPRRARFRLRLSAIFAAACGLALLALAVQTLTFASSANGSSSGSPPISSAVKPAAENSAAAAADLSPSSPLQIYPRQISLRTSRDWQGVVAVLIQSDGIMRDVSTLAHLTLDDPSIAKLDGRYLLPLKDGRTILRASYQGQSQAINVQVSAAGEDRPISFKLDVMPVLMEAGCNSGSCHGSARGKDGFHLSLFGFDPDGDYYRLTREIPNRRVNLAVPTESLMLRKALGLVPHTGGKRFSADSDNYKTLLRWITAGAPKDPPDVARVVGLELLPKKLVMEGEALAPAGKSEAKDAAPASSQQLVAIAHYSDGTMRDVTRLTVFSSNNDNSINVTPEGLISATKRGEAFVMARFSTFAVGTQVLVIPRGLKFEFPKVAENNYIDQLVDDKLRKMRIAPSQLCTDEEFLRRAYIDLVGLLPTRQEHDQFVNSMNPKKREALVDQLLQRPEFVDLWVMKWAELLKIRSTNNGGNTGLSYKAAVLYYDWLRDKISHNVPMDQIVRELISSDGGTFHNPPTNYYQTTNDVQQLAEDTAEVFMGVRTQCAQCHNHPFDRWTMNDYYGFAAFFSQVARKAGEDPREEIITTGGNNEVRNPVTNKASEPTFLGGGLAETQGRDRRAVLAEWITSPENPYFSRNLANRVWSHFFGRGITEPVDDVRVSNPPSNPELLDALAEHFESSHYDLRRLVHDICASRTYQLSTQPNATNGFDESNFSHAQVRRMQAEVMLDCIDQVTDTHEKFRGLPLGARAVQIVDGNTTDFFLTTFGRAKRDGVCTCEVSMQPNLSQALDLLNGDTVQGKILRGNVVRAEVEKHVPVVEIIQDLYVRCLGRMPTPAEVQRLKSLMPYLNEQAAEKPAVYPAPAAEMSRGSAHSSAHTASSVKPAPTNAAAREVDDLNDVFWALLNSDEFMFNH